MPGAMHIHRTHRLGIDEARRRVGRLAGELGGQFHLESRWEGNELHLFARQRDDTHLRAVFESQTEDPYFPVPLASMKADLRFHEIVISASGQTHTVQIWRSIWPRIRAYFYRYGRGQDLARMVDEHRDLLAALQARDRDRMLALLEQHIAVPVPAGAVGGNVRTGRGRAAKVRV